MILTEYFSFYARFEIRKERLDEILLLRRNSSIYSRFFFFSLFKYRDASSRGFYNSSAAFVAGGIPEIIHRGEHVKFIYLLVYLAKEPLHLYTCILNK